MAVIVISATATVPEPSKNRHAQRKLLDAVNTLLDDFEAKIKALGGAAKTDHASKREPGKRDLTPPPATPAPSQPVDLVDFAQVGAAVAEAAKDPTPVAGAGARRPHDEGRPSGSSADKDAA